MRRTVDGVFLFGLNTVVLGSIMRSSLERGHTAGFWLVFAGLFLSGFLVSVWTVGWRAMSRRASWSLPTAITVGLMTSRLARLSGEDTTSLLIAVVTGTLYGIGVGIAIRRRRPDE